MLAYLGHLQLKALRRGDLARPSSSDLPVLVLSAATGQGQSQLPLAPQVWVFFSWDVYYLTDITSLSHGQARTQWQGETRLLLQGEVQHPFFLPLGEEKLYFFFFTFELDLAHETHFLE